jgi:hypothetical protein
MNGSLIVYQPGEVKPLQQAMLQPTSSLRTRSLKGKHWSVNQNTP